MNINSSNRQTDFHGAAVIDEQGRETPITEAMIQRACQNLEKTWYYPSFPPKKAG